MKKLCLSIGLLLAGCAIFGPIYSGESTADSSLKADTAKQINLFFRAIHNCSPDKIHTEIISVPDAGSVNEIWTAKGCNQTEKFNIHYKSDGVGGTFIGVAVRPSYRDQK